MQKQVRWRSSRQMERQVSDMAEENKNQGSQNAPDMPHFGPHGPRPGGGPMAGRMNKEKPKNTMQTIRRLLAYLGHSRILLFELIGMMLLITVVDIFGPMMQQKAIDTISLVDGKLAVDLKRLAFFLVIMLCMYLLNGVLTYIQSLIAAKLSQRTIYMMRKDLFRKISKLPISYIDHHRHGDLMSRMTNDCENVSNAIAQSITTLLSAVLTLVGAFVMMIYYSKILAVVAVVTVPITILVSTTLGKFMQKYFKKQQKLLGQLNGHVEEMVIGYRTVVAYGKEKKAVEDFGATANELRHASIFARVWGSIMGPIMNFLGNFQYVLLAAVGGYLILNGSPLTIGSIQAMLQYSKKFTHPINMIANQYSILLTALAGAERVFEVMDQPDEVDEGREQFAETGVQGNIDLAHISFGYVPEEPVLKDLNLNIRAGEKIAIVGATGSGKTTIINLITRFYEVDGGRITIDGLDITKVSKRNLRDQIAIVLQDTVLFHDTIEANIKYGNASATDEEMKHAAHVAKADGFIERLPDQYHTMLTEGGSNLSQGQRQLLAIARAVLVDPKILILDEATSSVDTRTEMYIQTAMNNLMKNRTSLIIAHRLSTIQDADKIVVVSDGRIVEAGSHEELLALGGEYYQLYRKQFAGIAT